MGFRKGTGFTNLNKVITANKGNKLGSAVAGGISTQNQGVNTGVQTSQQKFQEEAQKNRLDTDEAKNKRENILGRFAPTSSSGTASVTPPATPTPSTSTVQPPAAPAQSPVSDQEIQDFTKFRTGTYAGPKELQDVDSLYGKAQQAEQSGDLSRSSGGRQELLRRFVGGDGYTQGQRQLDETLLGQDAEGVRAAAKQTRGASERVSQANAQAGNLAQEYIGRAKQFGQETGQRIQETKNPLSSSLDTRVSQAQEAETKRQANLKSIQDILTGDNADYAGLDKTARLGLGLQDAMNQGYLSKEDAGFLLGNENQTGLIARGQGLGLDLNSLINERIKNTAAQNTNRTGVASDEDIAKLNALDRLSGKQGSDLEFLQGQSKYAAGKTGFDLGSLEDFISRTEGEKAQSDKAYADKLATEQARYLNQAKAYATQGVGGVMDAAGSMLDPTALYNPSSTIGAVGNLVGGAGDAVIGQAGAAMQGQNAILEGLTKLNIGGKSLADTEGGKQLLKALELSSKGTNYAAGQAGQLVGGVSDGISNLGNASLAEQLTGAGLAKSLASSVKNQVGGQINDAGRALGGVGSSIGKAASSVKKKLKKMFSDEDLKTDIEYTDKDVQNFMDRLKPASYNYKDEVKNDPRASKDRQIGVMAQDLEKSKLGKEAVEEGDIGKIVDYKDLQPKMLASLAALNQRMKKLEGKE